MNKSKQNKWYGMSRACRQETGRRLAEAVKAWFNGFYESQRACARAFRIGRSTFAKAVADPDYKFRGQGYRSTVLKQEEEERVARFIHNRAEVGLGLTVKQVSKASNEPS